MKGGQGSDLKIQEFALTFAKQKAIDKLQWRGHFEL
jgi:hypothetical protein